MRCLSLADGLIRHGVRSTFVAATILPDLQVHITAAGHQLDTLPRSHAAEAGPGWDSRIWPSEHQRRDAVNTSALLDDEVRWVVLDHYQLDREWAAALEPRGWRMLVLDDLANRAHACDLLLDQSLGRSAGDYASLVPADCRLLLGPQHALIQPEYRQAREAVRARWLSPNSEPSVLVFLGSTDIGGITGAVVEALCSTGLRARIEVVIPRAAASRPTLERLARQDARVRLHFSPVEMNRLLINADIAVGGAGTASWERCCLGVPTVMLVLADNQRMNAAQLTTAGAAVLASGPADAATRVRELLDAPEALATMAAAGMAIVDGRGVERVVDHLLGTRSSLREAQLRVRDVSDGDMADVWLWRNDPEARQVSAHEMAIRWSDHVRWWQGSQRDERRQTFIGTIDERAIGMVRFDAGGRGHPETWRVSINLAPDSRGHGLGPRLLAAACTEFRRRIGSVPFEALIRPHNIASIQAFTRVGFVASASGGPNLDMYRLPADQPVRPGTVKEV